MSIEITAEDIYKLDGETITLDELASKMEHLLESTDPSNKKVKIATDKMAHYETFFKVLAIIQENGLDPILAYSK